MSLRRPTASQLDALIEQVTVDAYKDSEQLTGFETAFNEAVNFPCQGAVIGEDVEVLSLTTDDSRGELVATCRRAGHRYKVALQEIDLHFHPDASPLFAADKAMARTLSQGTT